MWRSLCDSLAARSFKLPRLSCLWLLFSGYQQVAAATIHIEPQVCVRAARGLGDSLWPGDGRNENKKPPKQQTLRPRSFPVVLCESNHCFEGKRTMSRSFLGCNVVRKKFPRNRATCANANIAVRGREDVKESVATWNSAVGSKVQRKKMAKGREWRKWGISTCREASLVVG